MPNPSFETATVPFISGMAIARRAREAAYNRDLSRVLEFLACGDYTAPEVVALNRRMAEGVANRLREPADWRNRASRPRAIPMRGRPIFTIKDDADPLPFVMPYGGPP